MSDFQILGLVECLFEKDSSLVSKRTRYDVVCSEICMPLVRAILHVVFAGQGGLDVTLHALNDRQPDFGVVTEGHGARESRVQEALVVTVLAVYFPVLSNMRVARRDDVQVYPVQKAITQHRVHDILQVSSTRRTKPFHVEVHLHFLAVRVA